MTSDLWVDLFEPQHLNEMIGQTELVEAFKIYLKTKFIPEMTIAGAPGCGKTLLMKCFATDMAMRVTDQAIDILGAEGVSREHPVEMFMRDAKFLQILEGTNQIQRLIISRSLLS